MPRAGALLVDDLRNDRARAAFLAGRRMEKAAEAGVDLVELRIDCLRREPDLKRILKERPTPLVFTIRRGVDGGLWRGNEDKRQQFLREADRRWASITSTSRWTSPPRSAASARPSGSSATTT